MNRERLLMALALDLTLGEPQRFHPVAGMGRMLFRIRRWGSGRPAPEAFATGAAGVFLGAVLWGIGGGAASRLIERIPARGPRIVAGGMLMKPTFALRALLAAGAGVHRALLCGDLPEARLRLGRDLVSRATGDLSAAEVAGAAISSLAENLSDSFVAPLIWTAAGGAPGAWAYRFLNTADAVLGYRSSDLLHLGRFAARADDAVNLLPSRATALLLAACAPLVKGRTRRAWAAATRDHRRTPSPNGGWPMAAAAGALGVELGKRNTYILNPGARHPTASDLGRALVLVAWASAAAAAVVLPGLPREGRT